MFGLSVTYKTQTTHVKTLVTVLSPAMNEDMVFKTNLQSASLLFESLLPWPFHVSRQQFQDKGIKKHETYKISFQRYKNLNYN